MVDHLRWKRCAGFLVQPPVIVKDEHAVIANNEVRIILDPAQIVGLITRGHGNVGDIDEPNHRRFLFGGQADDFSAVRPSDDNDRS